MGSHLIRYKSPLTFDEVCELLGWSRGQALRRLKRVPDLKSIALEGSGHSHAKTVSLHDIFGRYGYCKLPDRPRSQTMDSSPTPEHTQEDSI